MVDCVTFAPFMRIQGLACRILGYELRIVMHGVDLAAAKQRQ